MADTAQSEQSKQQDQQHQFDTSFFEQMGGPAGVSPSALGYDLTTQVVQSYFDQVEATTRQARRISDLWAQSIVLQQTTSEIARVITPMITKQVVQQLQRNPELLKQALR